MMQKRSGRRRRRRAVRRPDEQSPVADLSNQRTDRQRLGPLYAAGPALSLDGSTSESVDQASTGAIEEEPESAPEVAPLPLIQGTGPTSQTTDFAQTVRLQGQTSATFDGGSFSTENVQVQSATGCVGCAASECVRATGDLVVTYGVTTTVTLPSVADYPNLRPCQRERVQNAITQVLAPHEAQHVSAFNAYNGTTRTPFDLTLCRGDFNSRIKSMFTTQEQTRRAAAQAASDALDPFHFDVDLDCQDPPAGQSESGPGPEASAGDDDEP